MLLAESHNRQPATGPEHATALGEGMWNLGAIEQLEGETDEAGIESVLEGKTYGVGLHYRPSSRRDLSIPSACVCRYLGRFDIDAKSDIGRGAVPDIF